MPKKKKSSKNQEKTLFFKLVVFLINALIFLGYAIIFPFEKAFFATGLLINLNKKAFHMIAVFFKRGWINFTSRIKNTGAKIRTVIKSLWQKALFIIKEPLFARIFEKKQKHGMLQQKSKLGKKVVKNEEETKKREKKEQNQKLQKIPAIQKSPKISKNFVFRLFLAFFFGILFSLIFIFLPVYAYNWYKQLPQPELLKQNGNNRSTKILDREGRLLYEIYVDKKYDPVLLAEVPDDIINATLAIEDSEFYEHHGFRPLSMLRAAKATFIDDEIQGASTITQQLVKNVLLTPEQTFSRKAKELAVSIMVEREYTKNEILELYLNNTPYGGTAYGIQAAAQKYFGKNVWELDLAEAAMLAGLPSAPTAYSPVQGNYELAKSRQYQVLSRMMNLGYITKEQAEVAYQKELEFAPQEEYIRAPHFVAFVREELYKKYGQRMVDFGGLTVNTTLNLEIQEEVQKIVSEEVANGASLGFTNGAALVLDPRTGGILAYIGSVDYFEGDSGNFDVITAFRQPGSSIKPLTYSLAFENGYTPATIISDSPITYQSYGQTYSPKNYDNKYHGRITLRHALANSYNVPAVKLVNSLGVDNMVQLGVDLGLTNWVTGDGSYGLSVTLGGKEVRLLDLTNIYATFARNGIYKEVTPFVSINDNYGFEVYNAEKESVERRVLKSETAYLISHILSDNRARATAFGSSSKLAVPGYAVAVKTGTTNDIRDNLALGYTPSYTVGVWVGNNDNTPMNPRLASGLTGAAPIWNRIMLFLLDGSDNEPFLVPEGIEIKKDDKCGVTEVFAKGSKIPSNLCQAGDKDKKDDQKKNDR